jgi:hypothetical protein
MPKKRDADEVVIATGEFWQHSSSFITHDGYGIQFARHQVRLAEKAGFGIGIKAELVLRKALSPPKATEPWK